MLGHYTLLGVLFTSKRDRQLLHMSAKYTSLIIPVFHRGVIYIVRVILAVSYIREMMMGINNMVSQS